MRVSRDKLNKLAHTVADTLAEIDEVGFNEDRNTIRQEARKALEAQDHPRRLSGVGHSLPQVLQRRGAQAGHLSRCGPAALLAAIRNFVTLNKGPQGPSPL
jgi:hypothetical protein